jgi:hypothetical protein
MFNLLFKALAFFSKTKIGKDVLRFITKIDKKKNAKSLQSKLEPLTTTKAIDPFKDLLQGTKQGLDATQLEQQVTKLVKALGYKNPKQMFNEVLKAPVRFANNLGRMGKDERQALGEFASITAEAGNDQSVLSSS